MTVDLPRLYERDIDVLLQEELLFNDRVRELIARAIGVDTTMSILECRLSVVDGTGETDLMARFSADNVQGTLLIENKIDAALQPRQPERYRERATKLTTDHAPVFCLLISPTRYSELNTEAAKAFDAVITYEDLATAISDPGTERARHRAALLMRAIRQAKNPTLVIPAPQVTKLWQRVFEVASSEYSSLRMKKPDDKGSDSWWLIFKANLPKYVTIDWKVKNGFVDLSYWRGAISKPTAASAVPNGAAFLVTGTTTVFRIHVSKPPEEWSAVSDEQIHEALSVAKCLVNFHNTQANSF